MVYLKMSERSILFHYSLFVFVLRTYNCRGHTRTWIWACLRVADLGLTELCARTVGHCVHDHSSDSVITVPAPCPETSATLTIALLPR